MSQPMREVTIRLRPLPSSDWIIQHYSMVQASEVSLKHFLTDANGPLSVVSVRMNGLPLRFEVLDSDRLMVRPMVALQGGHLDVVFLAPVSDENGPQSVHPTYPLADLAYGLQRPAIAAQRIAR